MNSRTARPASGRLTGRTRAVTVLSIVAVGLAGAAAVGANIGILGSTSESSISGDAGSAAPSTQVVDVYLPATTDAAAADGTQRFLVDSAGTVALIPTDAGLALDEVIPTSGWSWTLVQSAASSLLVTFTNGTRTLEFSATRTGDGSITTIVTEPVASSAQAVCEVDDDDHDKADDHEDDDHDECEYEGTDDDD